jgi:Tfp pilus assembly protein PilN
MMQIPAAAEMVVVVAVAVVVIGALVAKTEVAMAVLTAVVLTKQNVGAKADYAKNARNKLHQDSMLFY